MTLKQLQSFIKWLRAEKISYHSISAGGVVLEGVVDGKIERVEAKPEPRESLYQQYGKELLRKSPGKPSEAIPDEALVDA